MDKPVGVIVCMLGVLIGCGDVRAFKLDPGDMDSDSMSSLATSLDGSEVHLLRRCTHCMEAVSEPLVAEIGDGVEFPVDKVSTLGSSCPGSPDPVIEVEVDHLHLILDFANIEEAARFPDADFDGYIFDVVGDEHGPILAYAWVDRQTNIDIDDRDLSIQEGRLEINFAGVAYDWSAFVQINLLFVDTAASVGEAEGDWK